MKIKANFHGDLIDIELLDNYTGYIWDDGKGYALQLDQCRGCGRWFSEDDEMYGDGYCTKCCHYDEETDQYLPNNEIQKD